MSSKTILLGLSIFWHGSEKSVHGTPSWELAPYNRDSEQTKDFAAWCRDASTESCFNECTGECGVVHFMSQFFVLDQLKSISDCQGECDMETDGERITKSIPTQKRKETIQV